MKIDNSIGALFAELESLLSGTNYEVFLRVFRAHFVSDIEPEQYIVASLGEQAVIGGIRTVTAPELQNDVEASLRYSGDAGHGPPADILGSPRFNELVSSVLQQLAEKCQQSTAIHSFWLKDGHPFYPVFWHFAYLIVSPGMHEVFIGSSSD